jgi:hypothetical protein
VTLTSGLRPARPSTAHPATARPATARAVPTSRTEGRAAGRPRRAPFVLLVLGLVGAGLCALLAINTVAAADEVRQRELTSSNADASDQAAQLRIEIANKQAPAALASAARALGMVPNPNPAFVIVGPDGSASVVGSPTKVSGAAVPVTPKPTPSPTTSSTATTAGTATTASAAGTAATAGASPTAPASSTPTTVTIPGTR